MENQEDIGEMILEILQDKKLTWIQKKVAIAMIAILLGKGEMTEEGITKELKELDIWDMDDLESKNFIDAMNNIYPSMEN
jgi:hypothetical protein